MSELTDKFFQEQRELLSQQEDALPIWVNESIECPICTQKMVSVHPKDIDKIECPACHNFIEPNK